MLTIGGVTCRVFLATGVTDLRRGFNGLAALVQQRLHEDPTSGALFVFCNRRRDMVKLFFADADGLWVCAKRLEQGTFRWPEATTAATPSVTLTPTELQLLVSGIDLARATPRKSWRRIARGAAAAR